MSTTGRHEFVGRLDRWCEVCNRPDRHPVHHGDKERAIVCMLTATRLLDEAMGLLGMPDRGCRLGEAADIVDAVRGDLNHG